MFTKKIFLILTSIFLFSFLIANFSFAQTDLNKIATTTQNEPELISDVMMVPQTKNIKTDDTNANQEIMNTAMAQISKKINIAIMIIIISVIVILVLGIILVNKINKKLNLINAKQEPDIKIKKN